MSIGYRLTRKEATKRLMEAWKAWEFYRLDMDIALLADDRRRWEHACSCSHAAWLGAESLRAMVAEQEAGA